MQCRDEAARRATRPVGPRRHQGLPLLCLRSRGRRPDVNRWLIGPRLRKRRIGARWFKALPKLLGADEAGADNLAPAPDQRANPKPLPARREGEAEKLR